MRSMSEIVQPEILYFMSVLDKDRLKTAEEDIKAIADRSCRGIGKRRIFTRAVDACFFTIQIQNWLRDHWAYNTRWGIADHEAYIDFLVREARDGYWPMVVAELIEKNATGYPNPVEDSFILSYAKPAPSADGTSITYNVIERYIVLPRVKMLMGPNTMGSNMLASSTFEPCWPPSGCDLVLTNVTTFPPELGYWEGDAFVWNFPVKAIYLYRCPDVDPRILNLPYVETLE